MLKGIILPDHGTKKRTYIESFLLSYVMNRSNMENQFFFFLFKAYNGGTTNFVPYDPDDWAGPIENSKTLSTLAGMPVGHYQLFKFSFASEVVLPDNRIFLLLSPTHFRLCPPLPFAPCVLERVMGTMFVRLALPANVDRA